MTTWRTMSLALALFTIGTVGAVSFTLAAEGQSLEQMVAAAKTPADHEAIAAYYEKEAQAAYQKHAEHKKLADFYNLTPALKSKSTTLSSHCGDAAKKYEGIAKDYQALAKQHKEMAKSTK